MTGWIILGALLLALALTALLPIAADAVYVGGVLSAFVWVGRFKKQVFPRKKKPVKPAEVEPVEEEEPPKARAIPPDTLPEFLRLILRILKRFLGILHIDILKLHFTAGSEDPYDAAMMYMAAASAMEAFLGVARGRIREPELLAGTDFEASKPAAEARLKLSARVWSLTVVGVAFLAGYLKIKRHAKKRKEGT